MKKFSFPGRNGLFLFFGLIALILLIEVSIRTHDYLQQVLFSVSAPVWLKNNLASYLGFSFAVIPLFLTELVLPNDEISKDHRNGILFWILSIQCNYFYSLLVLAIIHYFHIGPIFNLSFETMSKNAFWNPLFLNIFLIMATLLIFDFFYYWFHRTQHTIQFFWEFHKVHHSIKNLNSVVSYHHVLEELFRIPFITIPLAILIHINAPTLVLLSSFYAVYGQFIHMNAKINLGPLRWFFADNYYHRIHHSIAEIHYNKNYSAFFPIWDIVFRTAHFPKNNEFPIVGLVDQEQPKTLKEYLFMPKPFKSGFSRRSKRRSI